MAAAWNRLALHKCVTVCGKAEATGMENGGVHNMTCKEMVKLNTVFLLEDD